MNSQTVLSQGEGMTDNSSYGRLQSRTVAVSLTRLSSCNPKLVLRGGKGLTITSTVGGGLRSLWSACKEKEKPSAPPKTTSSSFSPRHVCVLLKCVLGYFATSRVLVKDHCSLLSIWQYICAFCMCKQCLFLQCLWDCVILGSLFPLLRFQRDWIPCSFVYCCSYTVV